MDLAKHAYKSYEVALQNFLFSIVEFWEPWECDTFHFKLLLILAGVLSELDVLL